MALCLVLAFPVLGLGLLVMGVCLAPAGPNFVFDGPVPSNPVLWATKAASRRLTPARVRLFWPVDVSCVFDG